LDQLRELFVVVVVADDVGAFDFATEVCFWICVCGIISGVAATNLGCGVLASPGICTLAL
jgi:hypothetical protein